MMKCIFRIWLLVLAMSAQAQISIGDAPETFSKIKFTYLQQSRFRIDEKGIYADTVYMTRCFLKDKMKVMVDSRGAYGFVPLSELDDHDRKMLIGVFGHQNFVINGNYNKFRDATHIEYSRSIDKKDKTQALLKKLFGDTYPSNVHRQIDLNFESGSRYIESGMISEDTEIDVSRNLLQLDQNTPLAGQYQERIRGRILTNVAYTNNKLSRFVSPIVPFANTGGVERIIAEDYTIELISVTYE
jgi:hypothetical protein